MKKTYRYALAAALLLAAGGITFANWPVPDTFTEVVTPIDAPPTQLVRFTATRTFARMPLEEQMKYLMKWQATPDDQKAKTLAELAKEPMVLDLSSALSKQASQLHLSRQYFSFPQEIRNQVMDQIIDAEDAQIKQVLATMAKAGLNADKSGGIANQKLRKLLIESTPAEVRMELAAFAQAKADRKRERGM
jgi:hypothetical protein